MYMYTFASSRSSAEREGGKSAQSAVGVSGIGVRNKWAALSWLVQERLKALPCLAHGKDLWAANSEDQGAGSRALRDLEPVVEGVLRSIRQGNAMGRRSLALLLQALNEGLSDRKDAQMRWCAARMLKGARETGEQKHAPLVRGAIGYEGKDLTRLSRGKEGAGEHADEAAAHVDEAAVHVEIIASRDVAVAAREDGGVDGRSSGRGDEIPTDAVCGEDDGHQKEVEEVQGENIDVEREANLVMSVQTLVQTSKRSPDEEGLDGDERSAGGASAGSTVLEGQVEGAKRCQDTGGVVEGASKQVPRTIVTAAWAYEAEADDELTFAAGDRLLVLDRGDDQGWVYAERLRRKDEANYSSTLERQQMRGLIPTTHLQALLAAWDWEALAEDELSFQAGDKLIVLDSADDVGWLYAELQPTESDHSTKRGLVPTTHLVLLEQDDDDAFDDVDAALDETVASGQSQVYCQTEPCGVRGPEVKQHDSTGGTLVSLQLEHFGVGDRAGMDVDAHTAQGVAILDSDQGAAHRAARPMTPRLEDSAKVDAQDPVASDQRVEPCPLALLELDTGAAAPAQREGKQSEVDDDCTTATAREMEGGIVEAEYVVSGNDDAQVGKSLEQMEKLPEQMGHGTKEEAAEVTNSLVCRFCKKTFVSAVGRKSHEKAHQALELNPGARSRRLMARRVGADEEGGESKKAPVTDGGLAEAASNLVLLWDKFEENSAQLGCKTRRAVSGKAARDKELVGQVLAFLGTSHAEGSGVSVEVRGVSGEGEQGEEESTENGEDLFVDLLGDDGYLDEDKMAARNLSVACLAERLLAWRGLAPGSHKNVVADEFSRLRNAMQVRGFGLREGG